MKSGEKSRAMFQRALESIPCGVNSNFRYWGDEETLVLKKGKGAYIWDQDDKKYVDYRLGFGPVILGHAYDSVTEKIKEGLEIGNAFSMTHEYEIMAAEKIKKLADVDLVRFANSGTESTMHAIRIARAFTGRDKVLKFEGAYHGNHDYSAFSLFPSEPADYPHGDYLRGCAEDSLKRLILPALEREARRDEPDDLLVLGCFESVNQLDGVTAQPLLDIQAGD